jgi:hypothetical protein
MSDRDEAAEPDDVDEPAAGDGPTPDQVATEDDADPYAREFAIDQLTGPEDVD